MITIDIEVACENGLPKPEEAIEPLVSITMKNHQSKRIVVWSTDSFENEDVILTYENAAAQNSFSKDEIFKIYLKMIFNFSQLANAEEIGRASCRERV